MVHNCFWRYLRPDAFGHLDGSVLVQGHFDKKSRVVTIQPTEPLLLNFVRLVDVVIYIN